MGLENSNEINNSFSAEDKMKLVPRPFVNKPNINEN